ncbi:hypothetical protein ACFL6I_21585 [candidate division KSB1 bacterium]
MKNKIFKIIKSLLRNLLAFIVGALIGGVTTLLFARKLLESLSEKDIGLGVIAVAPIMILMYLIMFGTLGGVLAVIIYNIRRYIKKKREKNR